jgi:hypothetical protein
MSSFEHAVLTNSLSLLELTSNPMFPPACAPMELRHIGENDRSSLDVMSFAGTLPIDLLIQQIAFL